VSYSEGRIKAQALVGSTAHLSPLGTLAHIFNCILLGLLHEHIRKRRLYKAATMAQTPEVPSGASTPRFVSQAATAEDLLKSQTVGLVNLADFRKRRADAMDQRERQTQDGGRSGTNTPGLEDGDG
jgi:hypothetical protein